MAEPSGAAGLSGDGVREAAVGCESDAADDRDQRDVPAVVGFAEGVDCEGPGEPAAGAGAEVPADGGVCAGPGAGGQRAAEQADWGEVGVAVSSAGVVGRAD